MPSNPIPTRLKEARKHARLSQRELGIQAGIHESSASPRMNQYEKGRHTPDIDTLRQIAAVLNVPISYFFYEDKVSAEIVRHLELLSLENKKTLLAQITEKDNIDS
ncbi:helix-turn-helix domain-containing protein [Marinomonas sp.]